VGCCSWQRGSREEASVSKQSRRRQYSQPEWCDGTSGQSSVHIRNDINHLVVSIINDFHEMLHPHQLLPDLMQVAVKQEDLTIVNILLAAGADPTLRDLTR